MGKNTSFAEDSVISQRRCVVALSFLLASLMALGQVTGGSLSGSVTDSAGAAASGIRITAKNEQTGRQYSAVSSSLGTYVFADLDPGQYTLNAEQPGVGAAEVHGAAIQVATR